ncbi:hypothetical protein ACVWZ8_000343 [Arthrobacter sp. UYCu723]
MGGIGATTFNGGSSCASNQEESWDDTFMLV